MAYDAQTLIVEPVDGPAGRKAFIRAAKPVYADDPNFVPPLEFELGARLDPKSNPVLKNAAHRLFLARKDGAVVGRVSAIVNPLHLEKYDDATGHFGFLDAIDDASVFAALLGAAEDWLRGQGMKRAAGPFSFSVNEECGLLVDGFDDPPYFMMPHARRWHRAHVEAAGYRKAMDMYALRWVNARQFLPERRKKFVERAISSPKISIRNIDFARFKEDICTCVEIFNDAWSDNWGAVPLTREQAEHMASELRPIIEKHNVTICSYDGEPVAFALVLPNLNQAIGDFDGRLLPFNWAKLIYRLKIKGLTQARMPLMGVRKKLQGKPVGPALAYKMIDMMNLENMRLGLQSSELSWILENNERMLNMLTDMGAEIYKTYRIYEKDLVA